MRPDPSTIPPSAATAPPALTSVAERVDERLTEILDHELHRWRALDPVLAPPLEALRRLVLGGGKRLRPAFCHWAFVGAGGPADDPRVLDTGAALELLQAFALVHDDVMDGSATRRGVPAIHTEFADRHRAAGWRGEARRFGDGVAILAGDVAHVYADRLMSGAVPDALAVWHELRIEVNVGQYLDIEATARASVDLATARRIARYKSGKYTIERPLEMGAALAGRTDLAPALERYGHPLGEAFQLRDDLLGAFGDADRTGKPVGDDLREGKPTPLLAIAHRRADAAQRRLLDQVGRADLDADQIAELQDVLVATGARDAVTTEIADLTATALGALDAIELVGGADAALRDLAVYVGSREW
ncbi:MAG TPA: polyprenyl synthetase family protein [Acidimicrobiales bacterium]|nr:polyprenyl synthetase family protein [Acidimicrobiales bacterium]